MPTHPNLMNLVQPQPGKMHQVSSQGRQKPLPIMAAAIGPDEPGKSVSLAPGETHTVAEIPSAGTILRIWMTAMQPLPGSPHSANHDLVLRFYWDGESKPSIEAPFGAFFGVLWGKYTHYVAEPLSCTSGGYNCRFPMPFDQGARIEVTKLCLSSFASVGRAAAHASGPESGPVCPLDQPALAARRCPGAQGSAMLAWTQREGQAGVGRET